MAVGTDRDAELSLERFEIFVVRTEERFDPLFRDRDAARGRSGDVGVSSQPTQELSHTGPTEGTEVTELQRRNEENGEVTELDKCKNVVVSVHPVPPL
jgi:hypothetical protein